MAQMELDIIAPAMHRRDLGNHPVRWPERGSRALDPDNRPTLR
jgi:hypothetical protein